MEGGRKEEKEPVQHYEAWCEISSLYGQELYKALEIRLENTVVFEVRYCRKIKEMPPLPFPHPQREHCQSGKTKSRWTP